MTFPEEQIEELKKIAPSLKMASEGGYPYFFIEGLTLPEGCNPAKSDVLLCPVARDGYESRLFFPSQISGCPPRNWNGNIRVLGKNWYAISWRVLPRLRLAEMLLVHLKALRTV